MSVPVSWDLSFYTAVLPFRDGRHVFPREAIRQRLQTLHQAGVQWIGIDGINLQEHSEVGFDEVVRQSGEWFDEFQLKISSLHFAGPTYAPVGTRQQFVTDNMLRYVELFHPWKPKALVVHCGWPVTGNNTITACIDSYRAESAAHGREALLQTVARNLKVMAQAAKKHEILLALENIDRFLPLGDKASLPLLVDFINEPNAGYCLDSGHAHGTGEDVVERIRRIGNQLFETHFHDNRARGKGMAGEFIDPKGVDEHLPVGFGTISWLDVIQALREIGFPGPVTFETGGWPIEDPVKSYRQAIAWWRAAENLAAKLELKPEPAIK